MGKGWFPEQHQGTGAGWRQGTGRQRQRRAHWMEAASTRSHSLSQTVVRGCPGALLHPLTLWGEDLYCSLSPLVAPWAAPSPSLWWQPLSHPIAPPFPPHLSPPPPGA